MRPSEIRDRILDDHRALRGELEGLQRLAGDVDGGAPSEALRAEAQAFLARLRTHMSWEEAYLLPALRSADAWGEVRAERLTSDHREQRELLDFILVRLCDATRPARIVAADVLHLIDLLRQDMREEEEELLDERVLRDDVVAIEVETG